MWGTFSDTIVAPPHAHYFNFQSQAVCTTTATCALMLQTMFRPDGEMPALCTIFTILLTLWNSEQKNVLLIKLFCFSSDFDETWWNCSTHRLVLERTVRCSWTVWFFVMFDMFEVRFWAKMWCSESSMFGHSMFGVFEVRYFYVRSKTM